MVRLSIGKLLCRSKDNWKLVFIITFATCLFVWNYSGLQSSSDKDQVPVVVSPLAINTRQVQSEQLAANTTNESDVREYDGNAGDEFSNATPRSPVARETSPPLQENKVSATNDTHKESAPVNDVKPLTPRTSGTPCPVLVSCADKQFSYYVQSGQGLENSPVICYNNELIVGGGLKDKNWGRGANIVVIHPQFKTVMDIKTFDLYDSVDQCMEMAQYLSKYIQFKAQILLASFDDMTANLCKSVKTLLSQYGSSLIKDLKFRENYVLVGEKGLPGNLGIEKKEPVSGKEWPIGPVNVSGCASQPISPKYVDVDVINGYELENCGVQKCGYDEIEMHISTVSDGKHSPKLCIGSSYIYYPGVKGGRGFNVVELDPISKTVVRTGEYDTYQVESSRLELFLENVDVDNYLIVIVADDGSKSLKTHARELLKSFGFNADLITMRTTLYFVGRKGMKTTPVQRVSQPETPQAWPAAINERFCLPTELPEATAQMITNKARTEFCAKHDSFADFCFVHHKTEPLIAAGPNDKYKAIEEIYDVPILVLGGVNNIALSHTLQSLLKQPGLDKSKVSVAYSTMFGDDYKPFIALFEFGTIEIPPINKYVDFLTAAFKQFWSANPAAKYAIVIDDEVVVKAGFMWFMGHALQAMNKDDSIGSASAWNPQGFTAVASDPGAVHVVSQFPGQAFLISKKFYETEIKGKESLCCTQRSIQQWFKLGTTQSYKYVVPEISRAGYFSSTAYSAQSQPLSNMAMSMPRTAASANLTVVPLAMDTVYNFDSVVTENLKSAYFTTEHDMTICKNKQEPGSAKQLAPFLPVDKKVVAVVYSQSSVDDYTSLKTLYSCFGLMYMDGYSPFGMYNGVTSLSLADKRIYLVGTSSPFYKDTVQSLRPFVLTM